MPWRSTPDRAPSQSRHWTTVGRTVAFARSLDVRRRGSLGRIARTHEADVVSVGIAHDRVARSPERVVRRLRDRVSHIRKHGARSIDRFARRELEAEYATARTLRRLAPAPVVRL